MRQIVMEEDKSFSEINEEIEDNYQPHIPGIPFNVLFRYLNDQDGGFTEIYYYTPDESDIFWALECPSLEYIIEGFDYEFEDDKWYVIEGMTVQYNMDYWGEVDEEWNYKKIRLATKEEIKAERLV